MNMYIFICLIALAAGAELRMSIEADGYPSHFYNGTRVNFTCTASGFADNWGMFLLGGSCDIAGCDKIAANYWKSYNRFCDAPVFTAPINVYCQSAPSSVSITWTVSEKMEGVHLFCDVFDGFPPNSSAKKMTVGTIRAAPTDLKMNAPTRALRGVEITFTCESEGAKPASAYNYAISQSGQRAVNTHSYTPPIDSTGNITLKCEDNIHPNLTSNVQLTKDIPLYYLDPPQTTDRSVSLNPSSALLTCDVSGYPVTCTWTCDDCSPADSSRNWIRKESRVNGQVETIICTASVDSVSSVNITWTVTWSVDAPTPSPISSPTATTNKTGAHPVIVAVAVVVPVVVAVVVVIVAYCCTKERAVNDRVKIDGAQTMLEISSTSRNTSGVDDNYTSLAPRGGDHPYDIILQQPQYENTHGPGQNQKRAPTVIQGCREIREVKATQNTGGERDNDSLLTESEDHSYEEMA